MGLRYDILIPFTEAHNNIIFVDRDEPNPGAGGLLGAATKFGNCDWMRWNHARRYSLEELAAAPGHFLPVEP